LGKQTRARRDQSSKKKEEARPRSSSLNRVVYPDWWGEQTVDLYDSAKYKKGRLSSCNQIKAKINKNVARHCEDNLDIRLRKVQEGVLTQIA
jgi:hypothetical protein